MKVSNTFPKSLFAVAVAAGLSFGLAGTGAGAAEADAAEVKPYEWSATLVSFDDTTNTAVFRESVTSQVNIEGVDQLREGDRLTLIWGGRMWASGIRSLAKSPALTPDTLSLPVEFVSVDSDGKYISFRVSVPETAVETLSAIEPGMRVTASSPRMATDWHHSIISLRHYNDVG